jgi:hypothetical protein
MDATEEEAMKGFVFLAGCGPEPDRAAHDGQTREQQSENVMDGSVWCPRASKHRKTTNLMVNANEHKMKLSHDVVETFGR